METVRDFIFLGFKITADGDCSHKIKRCLLLGWKAMTNLDNILKSRDISWLTNVHIVKIMVFPVVMYGCESWTRKKAERWWIDAFELWCWRSLLRALWTGRRSNQSFLKEISPEYSLEVTPIVWPHDAKSWLIVKEWCWERLKAGEGDNRGQDGCMTSSTQWPWDWATLEDSEGQGNLVCCSLWGCKELKLTEQLNNNNIGKIA